MKSATPPKTPPTIAPVLEEDLLPLPPLDPPLPPVLQHSNQLLSNYNDKTKSHPPSVLVG